MALSLKRLLLPALAYLLVVGMSAYAVWQIEEANKNTRAADCVDRWATAEATRDMGETVYRRNAETFISLARNAPPDLIATYREQVELDIDEIRGTVPDPDCDLESAQERAQ